MSEFTYRIEAEGLADPRVDDLDDLYEALVSEDHVLGPALAANRVTGDIDLIVTIEAMSEGDGARMAVASLARALVSTGRATSVARVSAPVHVS